MKLFFSKVTDELVYAEIASEEDREIYEYGLMQGSFMLLNIMTMIIIGILFNSIFELSVFTMGFIILRRYAGGYHAETKLGCYFQSTIMLISISIIYLHVDISIIWTIILLTISSSIILVLSPLEDYHKPLDEDEIRVYGKKTRIVLIMDLVLIYVSNLIDFRFLSKILTLVVFVVAFIVFVGLMKNMIRGWTLTYENRKEK